MIERIIADANHLSGIFLFIITLCSLSCMGALHTVKRELECLHEDHNTVTDAHERVRDGQKAKLGL